MKFTEEQRNKLRRSIESDFGCVCLDSTIDHIEQIISERDETIHPVPSIPIVGGGSVASDRTEPGESGQSAEDVESIFYKLCDIARRDGASIEYLTKPNAIEAMRLHASQVCADKDARIKELEGLLSSDSVYGLFRFAYKSPESAQVYEISKKLRELKTK